MAIRCGSSRDLAVRFGGYEGTIPRADAIHPSISGSDRDIAILSRVGKPTCFTIRVTHLEKFGAFVDLGCGVTSLAPLENISVSRIPHPSARFRTGQEILTLVVGVDREASRFYLSHKELLGTWMENAAQFAPGDAVTGIVRGIRDYGIFIELTPNLSGLADWRPGLEPGDQVSVYIKSIRPDTRKIKLQVIQNLGPSETLPALKYFITDGTVENWRY